MDAVSIAIVAFAINVSLAKLFAKKHAYEVDTNQELVAYGLTNLLTSFLNCFVNVASLSRSLVQEGVGGKTQVICISFLYLILMAATLPLEVVVGDSIQVGFCSKGSWSACHIVCLIDDNARHWISSFEVVRNVLGTALDLDLFIFRWQV